MWNLSKSIACAGLAGLAAFTAPATPASAADIYDKYGARSYSPYDDPRYADIYGHPAPPPRYAEPRYYPSPPPYAERLPERPYAYLDDAPPPDRDRYGYLRPMEPPRYRNAEPSACVPRGEIRRSLIDEGWSEFRDLEFRGDTAVVQARRPNGHLYSLKIDRCTGEIVRARPLDERPVPYAYRDRYGGRTY